MRRIAATLLVGPGISPADVPRLRLHGVSGVLSLQEAGVDLPLAAIERLRAACAPSIAYRNVSIRDYDPVDLIDKVGAGLAALAELHAEGRVVYLHCCEGVNRAPSLALGYLVLTEGLPLDEALAHLRAAHPASRPYPAFLDWLRERSTDRH